MKKLLLFFLLAPGTLLFGQTIVNSLPLNFDARSQKGNVLSIKDTKSDDIYVFTSDNKNISILKYNKSLFLTSQFNDSIKTAANRNLLGYSLGEDKNPILYWFSNTLNNIQLVKYYLGNQTSKSLFFNFPENHEFTITSFQKDNVFYVLGKEKGEQHLLLYQFKDGNCEIKMFDFSSFIFENAVGKRFNFSLILRNSIRKMEADNFNPLDRAAAINKIYIQGNHIILALDYNLKKTQVFDLNIENSEIKEKIFNQPVTKKMAETTNSFYLDKKLFQIAVNKDEFLFDVKDYESGSTLKSYSFSKNDTLSFKNSPFFLQINYGKPQQLKNTAKFLKNLSGINAVLSAMKNRKNTFVTLGGFGEYLDFYYQEFAFDEFGERNYYSSSKMVYFDTMLNENFDFIKDKNAEPLAIDNLFYFLSLNKNILWYDAIKLEDYQILSYYDPASKQLIMRRFTDGFIREDFGNPIMNKSIFSKPATFENIKSF